MSIKSAKGECGDVGAAFVARTAWRAVRPVGLGVAAKRGGRRSSAAPGRAPFASMRAGAEPRGIEPVVDAAEMPIGRLVHRK
jgi:hypothetical protein